MNTPSYDKVHLRFKLNGSYFDREDLMEVAYSYIKEGEPYEQSIGDFLMDWLNEKSFMYVRTSGSTGEAKPIRVQKQAMVNSAIASGDFFGINVGDSALHCLPAGFIAGKMMLVRAMILGLEIDLVEPSVSPLEGLDKIYDFSAMIPLQVENSLPKIDQIKKMIVGGAPISSSLIDSLQDKSSEIFETYGMTETVTHIAAKKINNFSNSENLATSNFKILPNITIGIDDRGCLVIDAPNIAEEVIVTNDLVELVSADEFQWKGRIDHVINSGGVKLIPEQIEKKLAEVITTRFFVHGIEEASLGQKLILIIEGRQDAKLLENIKNLSSLDKFENPKEVYFTDAFLETENGKIKRKATVEKSVKP
ncbi:o-succinylbenzoic acid-CoA ligase [Galbibacter marinus]|uniref:O-succinylbenzoic acid-CoA ligase n=1 Tax=Galbibacter marinus TaxID=555500 RepID=K2P4V7_9FLAO|nr:AMP-binding protein [Galbibacter marinus]EKF56073.1 o-succinylbenzoic acid-CoA ligase [Galbibacter marinus]